MKKDKNKTAKRKLRMGMVGGGPNAFIGEVHRKAARMDGNIDIVAGAFDINPRLSKQTGRELCIDKKRAYNSYTEMIEKELALPADQRIDFVSICTPNNWHFPMAKAFLEAGFHVMCEKPMTMDVKEAKAMKKIVQKSRKVFGLNHNYTGYPMVKLARDMVKDGDIGKVLKVIVQYPQGWLIKPIERQGQPQASWRTDPKQSGVAGCMGDIGTHAENLAAYITGLKIKEILADLTSFVKGRRLDDDGSCLIRYKGGAKGVLFASQVSVGKENDLAIWVHGDNGSLEWHQEYPNDLKVFKIDQPMQMWRRGNDYIGEKSAAAARGTRLPFGHPEAFLEAFANNYLNFAEAVRAKIDRKKVDPLALDFPGVNEGIRGMEFIEAVVKSSKMNSKWIKM